MIYGSPESGKSTLTYQIAANLQAQGLTVLIIDVEGSFDPDWAAALGVDLSKLIVKTITHSNMMSNMDEVLQSCRDLIASGAFDLVVLDSLQALGTKAEMNQDVTDNRQVGALANTVTQFLRVTHSALAQSGAHLMIIGQIRMKISTTGMGGGVTLSGGKALEHGMDAIIRLNRSGAKDSVPKDEKGHPIGHVALGFAEKCRGPGTHKGFIMPFVNGVGFSESRATVDEVVATRPELVNMRGGWFTWTDTAGEECKMQGKFALMGYFEERKEELTRLIGLLDGDEPTKEIQSSTDEPDDSGVVAAESGA